MYDEFIVASTIEREQDFFFLFLFSTRILISLSRMTRFHLVSWIFVNARQTVMKKCDENLGNFGADTERERERERIASARRIARRKIEEGESGSK